MTMPLSAGLLLLALLVPAAQGGEVPLEGVGAALAAAMRAARQSDGFELRMTVAVTDAQGLAAPPVRLSVIGQFAAERDRLLVRVLSTDASQRQTLAAERNADGRIRAIAYGDRAGDGIRAVDAQAGLLHSGLVLWDMLTPWWSWPRQQSARAQDAGGHACTPVRSRPAARAGADTIGEVDSCLDAAAGLALKTEIFDRRHALLRAITVDKSLRKGAGGLFAKRMTIHGADGSVTVVEVYGGDEHYGIGQDTFAALDAGRADTGTGER